MCEEQTEVMEIHRLLEPQVHARDICGALALRVCWLLALMYGIFCFHARDQIWGLLGARQVLCHQATPSALPDLFFKVKFMKCSCLDSARPLYPL